MEHKSPRDWARDAVLSDVTVRGVTAAYLVLRYPHLPVLHELGEMVRDGQIIQRGRRYCTPGGPQ